MKQPKPGVLYSCECDNCPSTIFVPNHIPQATSKWLENRDWILTEKGAFCGEHRTAIEQFIAAAEFEIADYIKRN